MPKRKATIRAENTIKDAAKFCAVTASKHKKLHHKHGFVPLEDDEETLIEIQLDRYTCNHTHAAYFPHDLNSDSSQPNTDDSSDSFSPFPGTPPPSPSSPTTPPGLPVNPIELSDALQFIIEDLTLFNANHPQPGRLRRSTRTTLRPFSYKELHRHGTKNNERGNRS